MPGIIIFHASRDDLERIFDEKLQPIKDKLDAINKMLDRLTNHGLAPKNSSHRNRYSISGLQSYAQSSLKLAESGYWKHL
ncbi:hypothetical protein FOCG_06045 [Fusarium oxysporum f. sp. radicis-lycopersici 26381]|nr:hypothetical protein FOCG_06045 [Fusarium oxysporum f. sp. radicis-lycopersici 26381]